MDTSHWSIARGWNASRLSAVLALGVLLTLHGRAQAEPTLAELTAALKNTDSRVRIEAIDALGRMGPAAKPAVRDLVATLSDPLPEVRAHVAHALATIGPAAAEATPELVKSVADSDAHVRRIAIVALSRVRPDPNLAIPALAKALEDQDMSVRVSALDGLTNFGAAAAPALAAALDKQQTRYWAALALGELGPDGKVAVSNLARALDDKQPEVRRECLIALAHIGSDASSAAPDVARLLSDANSDVRHSAAFALGRIGPSAASTTSALQQSLQSSDPLMMAVSAWALARIEPSNKAMSEQAFTLLVAELKNPSPKVQSAALRGLVELKPEPAKLVPVLISVISEGDEAVMHEAVVALTAMGDAAVPAISAALRRPESAGRAAALVARVGPAAAAAVPVLVSVLNDKKLTSQDVGVRREVLFALAAIGPQAAEAAPSVVGLLDDADPKLQSVAAYAAGAIGAQAARQKLLALLTSQEPMVAVTSGWALAQLAPNDEVISGEVLRVLLTGLRSSNPQARRGAADGLGSLGQVAKPATEALQEATRDPDEGVRLAAAAALERIGGLIIQDPRPVNRGELDDLRVK